MTEYQERLRNALQSVRELRKRPMESLTLLEAQVALLGGIVLEMYDLARQLGEDFDDLSDHEFVSEVRYLLRDGPQA